MPTNVTSSAFVFAQDADLFAYSALLFNGYIGFTLWQFGLCQPKNTSSIIINNLSTIALAVICYWATGFAFAFGNSSNLFLSYSRFFLIDASPAELPLWYWHCVLTTLFIIISNGGFVERMKTSIYYYFAILFSCIFYPIGSHWCWHKNGWLYYGIKDNSGIGRIHLEDRGGAGPIHVGAGTVALISGLFLRPRKDRTSSVFDSFNFVGGQTNTNVFLGGFAIILCLTIRNITVCSNTSLAAMNTILASSASAATAFMFKRSALFGENWNVKTLLSGLIIGLVSVSPGVDAYLPYGAFAVGLIAGIVYIGWSVALKHNKFDDVVDTVAIHLGGGAWGLLAASLFNKSRGVFYVRKVDSYRHIGWSMLAILVYFAWHGIGTCVVLLPFYFKHCLRYKQLLYVDTKGIDVAVFYEPAYPNKQTFSGMKTENNNGIDSKTSQSINGRIPMERETKIDELFTSGKSTFQNYAYETDFQNLRTKEDERGGEQIESWSPGCM